MKHSRRYASAQRRYKRNAGAGNIRHFIERWVHATGPIQIAEVRDGKPLRWLDLGSMANVQLLTRDPNARPIMIPSVFRPRVEMLEIHGTIALRDLPFARVAEVPIVLVEQFESGEREPFDEEMCRNLGERLAGLINETRDRAFAEVFGEPPGTFEINPAYDPRTSISPHVSSS